MAKVTTLTGLIKYLKDTILATIVNITDAAYAGDPNGTRANNEYFNNYVHRYLKALSWGVYAKNTLFVKLDAPADFLADDGLIYNTAQAALDAIPTTGASKPTASNIYVIVGDPTVDWTVLDWTDHDAAGTTPYIKAIKLSDISAALDSDTVAALAGTAGTPSASNLFVTDEDPRLEATENAASLLALPNEFNVVVSTPTLNAALLQTGSGPANCKIFCRRVYINRRLPAKYVSAYIVAVGGSGQLQLKYGLFSPDGLTKVIDWPWSPNVAAGAVNTATHGSSPIITPGEYIFAWSGVVWNSRTATLRSQVVSLNDWLVQMNAISSKLGAFHSDQVITVADVTNPTEAMPSTLGVMSYASGALDETLPLLAIHS